MEQLCEKFKLQYAILVAVTCGIVGGAALLFSPARAEAGEAGEREFKIVEQSDMEWTAVAAFPGLEVVLLASQSEGGER